MKITADGEVTIPPHFRERLGRAPDTEVEFDVDGEYLRMRKIADSSPTRGQLLVEHMRGRLDSEFTTDDLMEFTRGPFTDIEAHE